jgi:AcrR family transcriptional regulator
MSPDLPPRLSRAEQREVTRQRLLDAAAEVFAEHGVDGAAIDDIVARAGYSRGAFYSNFSDKTELLIALCDHRLATFRTQQLPNLLQGEDDEQLSAAARWLAAEEPPLEVLLVVELARQRTRATDPDPALNAAIGRVLDALGGLLADADADADLDADPDPKAGLDADLDVDLDADPDADPDPDADAGEATPVVSDQERADRSAAVLAAVLGADLLRHLGLPPTPRVLELLLVGLRPQAHP